MFSHVEKRYCGALNKQRNQFCVALTTGLPFIKHSKASPKRDNKPAVSVASKYLAITQNKFYHALGHSNDYSPSSLL